MKEFLKNPKNTAILGLLGGILMLCSNLLYNYYFGLAFKGIFFYSLKLGLESVFSIGIIIYFLIVIMRLYSQKGNIKVAKYMLLVSLIVHIITIFLFNQDIITSIIFLAITLYIFRILFNKDMPINNIAFLIVLSAYSLLNCFSIIQQKDMLTGFKYLLIMYFSYIFIIPYFYNYYELLKGEN